ncbi:hypothetical protein AMS68_002089 [Peltaster fructicola]|uniref:Uncharacterized protein n=1 Tax=Peltaster fructicola TaxID=286661 RepID=A0A6H0XP84_9PEZI|nr:hypothetical protein AMS68_002089 [Peltaster fructicola]
MNPQASVFVPISALNAPPTPKFERTFLEFRDSIYILQDLVDTIIKDDTKNAYNEYRKRFDLLHIRLLGQGKYLTRFTESAVYAGSFVGEEMWIDSAIDELKVLCHRYSWCTIRLISWIESHRNAMLGILRRHRKAQRITSMQRLLQSLNNSSQTT